MLWLALMSSENRAASLLGPFLSGRGLGAAVAAMNAKAKALGMNNTRYVDTTGLSPENVSTARSGGDGAAAQRYPLIREFSTQPEEYVQRFRRPARPQHFQHLNALVKSGGWDISLQKDWLQSARPVAVW